MLQRSIVVAFLVAAFPRAGLGQEVESMRLDLLWDAPEALELTAVTGAAFDSRGHLYLADWYGRSIHVLNPEGELIRTTGRAGRGPGEFESIRGLQVLPGDTLFAFDPVQRRVTYLSPPGDSAVEVDNLGTVGFIFHVFRSPQRSRLGIVLRRPVIGTEVSAVEGRHDQVVWADSEGRTESDPVVFSSPETLATKSGGHLHVTPHPFGAAPHYAIGPDGVLWVAEGGTGAIYTIDEKAGKVLRFNVAAGGPEITESEVAARINELPGALGSALRDDTPDQWPPVCGIIVPKSEELWICRDGRAERGQSWSIHTPDGAVTGRASIPPGYELLEIAEDKAAAVRRDDFGIPRVGMFSIQRN